MLKSILKDSILKRMFKNASVIFSGSTIAGLMTLVGISLVARALGAEKLGIFAMIQSFVIIIDRLMNFQCWQAMIKFGADFLKQDKKEDFKSLIKFCIVLDFATALIGTILAASIIYFFGSWKGWQEQTIYAGLVFSFWILFNLNGTAIGLLRLFNKFKFIAAAKAAASAIRLVLIIFAYLFSGGLTVFAIIWVLSIMLESALLLVVGWREAKTKTGGCFLKAKLGIAAKDKTIWKFVWSTNLNQSVRLASRELDVLITGAVLGPAVTGLYKIARQFATILAHLTEPIYQAVYPEMAHLTAEKRFTELKNIALKTGVIAGGVSLFIWFAFVLFGKWILNVAVGAEYIGAWATMIVFMFAFVIWGFVFCLPAGLLAMGRAGNILFGQVVALAAFLPILYLLLVHFGLIGAATAQVIFFAIYSLFMLQFFAKHISIMEHRFPLRNNHKIISR
ncbi:MAG: oligosaccharide flippase family protein [Phycisphaerae bacterium]|nr:oligosaccharide flippase family protein [Phycisphaerae bacterium]